MRVKARRATKSRAEMKETVSEMMKKRSEAKRMKAVQVGVEKHVD